MMAVKNTDQSTKGQASRATEFQDERVNDENSLESFFDRQMETMDERMFDQPPCIESSVSSPSLERKPSLGEDPAAMTIQFLRARLLSERSISKTARQRAHHLAKKVSELERQLELEMHLRNKVEAVRLDALTKFYGNIVREYGEELAPCPRKEDFDKKNECQKAGFENAGSLPKNDGMEGISELERVDIESVSQLNHKEDNNIDNSKGINGSTESHLLQKGDLAWETQKGVLKQQDVDSRHSSKRLGRNSCIKTGIIALETRDSNCMKGMGKSVRQIRNKETRLVTKEENKAAFVFSSEDVGTPTESSSQEEYSRLDQKGWVDYMVKFLESSSIQEPPATGENVVLISDSPRDSTLKTGCDSSHTFLSGKSRLTIEPSHENQGEASLDNEMERDIEKVLERQAELIEKYKAEENAQRAWEEKYREQSLPVSTDIGQDCSHLQQLKERVSVTRITNGEESKKEGKSFQLIQDTDNSVGHKSREPVILEESLRNECNLISNDCKVHDRSEDVQINNHTKTDEGKAIAQPHLSNTTILNCTKQENMPIPDGEVCLTVDGAETFHSENISRFLKGEDMSHAKDETVKKSTKPEGTVLESQVKLQNQPDIVERRPHESELDHIGMGFSQDFKTSIRTGVDMTQERRDMHLESTHLGDMSPDLTGKSVNDEAENFNSSNVEEGGDIKSEDIAGDETGSHRKSLSSSFKFNVYADFSNEKAESQELFLSRDSIKDHLTSLGKQVLEGQGGLGSSKVPQVDFSFVQPKPVMYRDTTVQGTNERSGQPNVDTSHFLEGTRAGSHGPSFSNQVVPGVNTILHEIRDRAAVSDTFTDMREACARNNFHVPWLERSGLVDQNFNHKSPGLNGMANSQLTGFRDAHHEKRGQVDQLNQSPWEEAFRRRIRDLEIEHDRHGPFQNFNNYPHIQSPYEGDFHQEQLPCSAAFSGRRQPEFPYLDPTKRVSTSEHYNQRHDGAGGYMWQHTTMAGYRRSVDGGFDNVLNVLNALQLAKCQIQSSVGRLPLSAHTEAIHRNGYGSRGQYLAELPPGYSGPSDHRAEVVSDSYPYTRVTRPCVCEVGSKVPVAHVASSSRHPLGSGKETSHNHYFPAEDPLRMQNMLAMADMDDGFLGRTHHHFKDKVMW